MKLGIIHLGRIEILSFSISLHRKFAFHCNRIPHFGIKDIIEIRDKNKVISQ